MLQSTRSTWRVDSNHAMKQINPRSNSSPNMQRATTKSCSKTTQSVQQVISTKARCDMSRHILNLYESCYGNTHLADALEKKMFVSLVNRRSRGSSFRYAWIDFANKLLIPLSDPALPRLNIWLVRHTWQTPAHPSKSPVSVRMFVSTAVGTTASALFPEDQPAAGNMITDQLILDSSKASAKNNIHWNSINLE